MSETFFLIDGDTGSGKSVWMADKVIEIARRNARWHKMGMPLREIWSCMRWSDEFNEHYGGLGGARQGDGKMLHWWDSEQFHRVIPTLRNCDIFIDEIGAILPNDGWKDTPLETRRFLAQHRKRGIEIYANTQDFSMVDINARRMMSRVFHAIKVIGSRDISATKPPPKYVWGIIAVMEITNFKTATSVKERQFDGFPSFIMLDQDLVDIYDTTEDIKGAGYAPLRHVRRVCETHGEEDGCGFEKIMHI